MRCVLLVLLFLAACGGRAPEPNTVAMSSNGTRFADSDPHDWQGRKPWQYAVHGIDVSKYQGDIDWRAVRRSGIKFAYIKATEGGDHLDETFKDNWRGAARAGVKRGAYHFYYFCRPAYQQANWFIQNVPKSRGALPPVLDMEWNHRSPTCRFRPEPAKVRSEMRVFLDRVEGAYGQRPVIYSTVDFYHRNELWRVRGYEFWLRSVASHPSKIYPNRPWAFWQYTGTGIVPGVPRPTDINVFSGGTQAWSSWVARNAR
nr:GH25 family lysozyme [Amylibacter kogurei]